MVERRGREKTGKRVAIEKGLSHDELAQEKVWVVRRIYLLVFFLETFCVRLTIEQPLLNH